MDTRTKPKAEGGRHRAAFLTASVMSVVLGVAVLFLSMQPSPSTAASAHTPAATASASRPGDPGPDTSGPGPSPDTSVPATAMPSMAMALPAWQAQLAAFATLSPRAIPANARRNNPEFNATGTFSHQANDDPIVYPGRADASHTHTFLGNDSTGAAAGPS